MLTPLIHGRIYKPGGGLVKRGGISPQKKSGALAGRLGVRPGTDPKINYKLQYLVIDSCMLVGSAGTVGDARSKIGGGIISDARLDGATTDSS